MTKQADFIHTDDGIEILIPDDVIEALGWQDGDPLELSMDAEGKIICRKAE